MRKIKLTKGLFAIVDAADFEILSKFKWCATQKCSGFYAERRAWDRPTKTGRIVYMARQIMGARTKDIVDHINGDTLDNRRCNLRIVDKGVNAANSRKRRSASGYRGVRKQSTHSSYTATIKYKGKQFYLGNFRTKDLAAIAYDIAARFFYGETAKLNFPKGALSEAI